jgi:hypothetical protein
MAVDRKADCRSSAMSDHEPPLNINELSHRSRLSVSTLNRLKKAGLIPFFQPGGKGSRVTFPPDAIELACAATASDQAVLAQVPASPKKLSGPSPKWLQPQNNQNP